MSCRVSSYSGNSSHLTGHTEAAVRHLKVVLGKSLQSGFYSITDKAHLPDTVERFPGEAQQGNNHASRGVSSVLRHDCSEGIQLDQLTAARQRSCCGSTTWTWISLITYHVRLLYVKHKDNGMVLSQPGFLVASALCGHKWPHKDTDDFLLQLVLLRLQSL